jgi:hypothetical protein
MKPDETSTWDIENGRMTRKLIWKHSDFEKSKVNPEARTKGER